MKEVELILANFDARIPKIEIKPKNMDSKVIIMSKIYDDKVKKKVNVKVIFNNVVAIDFRINYFDCSIGAEAMGLYCIKDENFLYSLTKTNYERRKEIFLFEEDYNYEENDKNDLLNSFDIFDNYKRNIKEYNVYAQNVDGGVYIIVAKNIEIER